MQEEKGYILWMSRIPGIGAARLRKIQEMYGSLKEAWKYADSEELQTIQGISSTIADQIVESRKHFSIERELRRLEQLKVCFYVINEPEYPSSLLTIYDPPPILYMKGSWLPQDERSIAIIGSRQSTNYGHLVTRKLSSELVHHGVTIVSGLARGIDSHAHEAALQGGGRTIAVLAGGFSNIYPRENTRLAMQISEQGALISEYPPETTAKAGQFPARNRIISGLSKGVVVVEAGGKSGALITADQALEQGRDVFAIPGPITALSSQGTNDLIRQGAKMVTCVADILEEYPEWTEHKKEQHGISEEKLLHPVLKLIGYGTVHVDELYRNLQIPLPELHKQLIQLEISGVLRSLPGGYYARADL